MENVRKIANYIRNPRRLAARTLMALSDFISSDKLYLKARYRLLLGRKLNLDNPVTFSEKINWLKLFYHHPDLPKLADKSEAKKIAAAIIGEEHIIPTLGVWQFPEEIDFDALPEKFVLKCTHDSASTIICRNKEEIDIEFVKRHFKKMLRRDYSALSREWAYKDIPPRIIAEEYIAGCDAHNAINYKFYCFDGEPKLLYTHAGMSPDIEEAFFDMDFQRLDCHFPGRKEFKELPHPRKFEQMKEISRRLSSGWPHMRIDLYEIDGHIYFGEFTIYSSAGTMAVNPDFWDTRMGQWLHLPPPIQ